jgi:tagaturonate reductase
LSSTIAFYKGKRGEETIALNDSPEILEFTKNVWAKADGSDESLKAIVTEILGYEKNWKMNLNTVEGLNEAVTKHLINIEKHGMQKAIEMI